MIKATWYISKSLNSDTVKIIYNMAAAVKNHAREIDIKIINAHDKSSSIFEKSLRVFKRADIWHLFGKAPLFWKFIRVHSKTVHTQFNEHEKLSGYPAKFLFTNFHETNVILPSFGSLVLRAGESDKAIYTDDVNKIDAEKISDENIRIIDLSKFDIPEKALSGIYITYDPSLLSALRCGLLTMRGLAIASVKSEYLNEILAPDGYYLIDENSDMSKIIRYGLNEKGRHLATSARHFIKTRHSDEKSAESIFNLYRAILGANK